MRYIQDMRKEADYKVDARIKIYVSTGSQVIKNVLAKFGGYIKNETLAKDLILEQNKNSDLEKDFEINKEKVIVGIVKCD